MGRRTRRRAKIIVDSRVILKLSDISLSTVGELRQTFTVKNPKHQNAARMGFWTKDIPKTVTNYEIDEDFLYLPRGALKKILSILKESGVSPIISDRTITPPCIQSKMIGGKMIADVPN